MIKKKKCLVSLEKPTQISYWLYLARIDIKGWRELLYEIVSFLKLRKAAPSPLFPPLMKDPRPKKMGWIKKKAFLLIQGAAKPIYFKAKGGLTWLFLTLSHPIQIKFSYVNRTGKVFRWYGPWTRTSNCLGVALCPAWWTKSSLLLELFLPHTFALFHRRGNKNIPSGQRPKFPLDSFLSLLCCSKMRVLGRRESGKNPSDSVTEQSSDSSVTQDDPTPSTLASFAVYPLHPSEVEERKGTINNWFFILFK